MNSIYLNDEKHRLDTIESNNINSNISTINNINFYLDNNHKQLSESLINNNEKYISSATPTSNNVESTLKIKKNNSNSNIKSAYDTDFLKSNDLNSFTFITN